MIYIKRAGTLTIYFLIFISFLSIRQLFLRSASKSKKSENKEVIIYDLPHNENRDSVDSNENFEDLLKINNLVDKVNENFCQ